MSMTVSVRVAHKSMAKAGGQRRHDMRSGVIPKYVDQSRTEQNSIIQPVMMEAEAREACMLLRSRRGCKRAMKSDAAVLTSGIITFGTEAQPVIESLSREQQDQVYQEIAQRLATRLDTRLVGLTVHRDESAPHAHFSLLAVNRHGWPLSKVINRDMAKQLQDIAGQVLAERGLSEITRGKSKEQRILEGEDPSKTIHRTVAQLHKDLPREIEAAQEKLAKNLALIEKAKQDLEAKRGDADKVEKRMQTYERRAAEAERKVEALRGTIAPWPRTVTVTIKKGLIGSEQKEIIEPHDFRAYEQQMLSYLQRKEDENQDLRIENQELKNKLNDPYVVQAIQQKQQDAMQQQQALQQREDLKNQRLAELRQQQQPAQQPQPAPFFNPFRP